MLGFQNFHDGFIERTTRWLPITALVEEWSRTLLTNLCEKTRAEAFDLMLQHAGELGGNAVVGARYDATEVMQGVTEVLAYGTAVFVEPTK